MLRKCVMSGDAKERRSKIKILHHMRSSSRMATQRVLFLIHSLQEGNVNIIACHYLIRHLVLTLAIKSRLIDLCSVKQTK